MYGLMLPMVVGANAPIALQLGDYPGPVATGWAGMMRACTNRV
jgi:hypothetical protein